MPSKFVPSVHSNGLSRARFNPTTWADVVKQWDQYRQCAAHGDRRGLFYHPDGTKFHPKARSKCGGALPKDDAVDCGVTAGSCNDKWNQFKSTLDRFNRESEYAVDILYPEFTWNVSPKTLEQKLVASVTPETPAPAPSPSPIELLPALPPPAAPPLDVEPTAEDLVIPEEEPSMMPYVLGGLLLVGAVGGFLFMRSRKGKKKKKSTPAA